jgi:molecular chaperone IbpA
MTQYRIHALDLSNLHRNAIGFDQLFEQLNRTFTQTGKDNYPPHNVIQQDDTNFVIEVAVAGFLENEVNVELEENILTVTGEVQRNKDATVHYLHKGISTRNFTRRFPLADNVEVRSASVSNGILAINLVRIVPDEQKPKKIAITFTK